jgi:hypothetical protein
LGSNFFNNCTGSSRIWIWRYRRGVGRNRQVPILSVPGDVRDLFYLRVERQRSPIISDRLDGRLHYPLVIQFRKRIVGCACLAANHVGFGTANPG